MKMAMAMAAAATSYFSSASGILLYALFFAAAGTHGEATEVATSEVPSILPVCKTVGGGSTFFDVQFCLEALGSDDRSANAGTDYRTYSGIAADLLTANATSTAAKIGGLLREHGGGKGGDEATTRCLRSCQALYGGVVRRQPGCAAAVRGRTDGEATRCLEEASRCSAWLIDHWRRSFLIFLVGRKCCFLKNVCNSASMRMYMYWW